MDLFLKGYSKKTIGIAYLWSILRYWLEPESQSWLVKCVPHHLSGKMLGGRNNIRRPEKRMLF